METGPRGGGRWRRSQATFWVRRRTTTADGSGEHLLQRTASGGGGGYLLWGVKCEDSAAGKVTMAQISLRRREDQTAFFFM